MRVAAKPKLVQISAAYGQPAEGSAAIPRNKYIEIKQEKPQNNKQRDWPEYKTCKSTTEAIITRRHGKRRTPQNLCRP
jgi:ParB family chromosome partitioning protein